MLRELSPALNDDDAQGLTKLTNQEKMKKIQTKMNHGQKLIKQSKQKN
jgi:hypothetical protein